MKVADDGHPYALLFEALDYVGDGFSGIVVVDGYANYFAASPCQGSHLFYGAGDVGSVGVGHGLHHNWCIAAHANTANRGR